jgi:cellobiose-specific phosphotransferase system component IIC
MTQQLDDSRPPVSAPRDSSIWLLPLALLGAALPLLSDILVAPLIAACKGNNTNQWCTVATACVKTGTLHLYCCQAVHAAAAHQVEDDATVTILVEQASNYSCDLVQQGQRAVGV